MLDARIIKARRAYDVDVQLSVQTGERVALFGASGEGKSTILSCVAGIEVPDRGEILLDETRLFPPPIPLYQRPIGYLTQKDLLFPHLTVARNVCFGLSGSELERQSGWIDELKQRLEIGSIWNASSRQISGGQARRVALARMLARRPPLVLLDEPFTGLDGPTIRELIGALLEWQGKLRFTLIAVDHRADILETLCDHAFAIERGRIVQQGTWAVLSSKPATPSLARLLDVAENNRSASRLRSAGD